MHNRITVFAIFALPALATASGWQHYGGDAGGQRYAAESEVTPANVAGLVPAWQFRTGDATDADPEHGRRSSFRATPVLFADNLLFSTGFNRVFSIGAETGELRWVYDPKVDFSVSYSEMFTSRGVSVWIDRSADSETVCANRVLLGTLDARLIALDANTGKVCEQFGRNGAIDLSTGVRNFRRGEYSLTSPVTVVNDVIVVGSSVGDNGGVKIDSGIVRGYAAATGRLLWSWDPVPGRVSAPGGKSWGRRGGKGNGGTNVWSVISADPERDLVFLPTTSPSPDFFGGKRPGNNRFANSVVALRATTGEVVWDFQLVHHDLWDYDLAAQPLLIDIERDGERIPAVVQATKMGHVFTLHRETGVPLFPVEERTVPGTTIAGEVTSATQPFPVQPPPLHDQRVTLWDYSADNMQLCSKLLEGIRYDGIFTPPSTSGTLLFPGNAGGTNWGSMAADPQQQLAVLAINRLPTVVELIPRAEFESRRKHRANDLVGKQYTAQIGTPYGMARFEMYNPQLGIPCLEGPWGELIALDMSQGKVKWRAPLGVWPGLSEHPEARHWGSLSMGGPLITAGGLVLIAPRFNKTLLAYELATGEIVWRGELPAMATATPMSYHLNGATYVVIAAGGDVVGDQSASDFVVAFKLADDNSIEIPRPLSDTEKIR